MRIVDLNEVVRSVEKFLLRVIGENIACTITLNNGTMPVFADASRFEQVLMNLATNARDAMPNGGSLVITSERIRLDETFVTANGHGNNGVYAMLTVTDNGTGMDDETCRQVFDPFFTKKGLGKGTGLGLAVVYGIIKQHDGQITVSSSPGRGTTFRVYLPLTELAENEKNRVEIYKKPDRGTETILLAEDDETVRNMVQSLLESFGYEVITAVDGEDAVLKFRENRKRVRLLLFDVIMPKKNGMVAYDEIRAIEPGMKVIFASGYSTEAVNEKAQKEADIVAISKPYLPSNLLTIVRGVLDNVRSS